MGFKAERPETIGELPDEMDMNISDDEGVVMDVDELMGMLGLSEEEDKKRMRQLHKVNSIVVEQEMTPCLTCVKNALGKYSDQAESISTEITSVLSDDKISKTEFISLATKTITAMLGVSMFDIPSIATKLYECVGECKPKP
jgi:hypothetical protein